MTTHAKKIYPVTKTGTSYNVAEIEAAALKNPHTHCKYCGESIWFGHVVLKHKEFWAAFAMTANTKKCIDGYESGEMALLELHDCKQKPIAVKETVKYYQVVEHFGPVMSDSVIEFTENYHRTNETIDKELADKVAEELRKEHAELKDVFTEWSVDVVETEKEEYVSVS